MQIEIPKPNGKVDLNYVYQLVEALQMFVNTTNDEIKTLNDQIAKEKK